MSVLLVVFGIIKSLLGGSYLKKHWQFWQTSTPACSEISENILYPSFAYFCLIKISLQTR
jgi:hypothetical protein